ncbi:HAD family hydrolase [Streptomyces sp. ISL-12]|uniref:HAD family hydrolase n=1 Tax=Streptomyces sp. ISL-12 TaxID=2819177 RepID=UPI0027E1A9D9|nr:HAD family hydrolase [Streptomyces sp. ISL-12]
MASDTQQSTPVTASAESLRKLTAPVRYVLWDLDGPICRLFAGHPAGVIARDLVAEIDALGLGGSLTERERAHRDPQAVLLRVSERHPGSDLVGELEEWLTRQELAAVPGARPTPYADPLIRTWTALGAVSAVTTNNSARVAAAYLETRGLTGCFSSLYGRTGDLGLMKPHPHALLRALTVMGADPSQALMIGDSPSDLAAARAAGVPFLGYARSEETAAALVDPDAAEPCVVTDLSDVRAALLARSPFAPPSGSGCPAPEGTS